MGLGLACGRLQAAQKTRPLVSVLGTCATLTANTYPGDTLTWFDPTKQAQIVFYAHLLFPMQAEAGEEAAAAAEAWHPPMPVTRTPETLASVPPFSDEFHASAEWVDPDGKRVAFYSLTFPARARQDYIRLKDRWYVPHTFAMAIGTRDLRLDAGQTALPDKVGQYHIRLNVEGQSLGLAFFRILKGDGINRPQSAPASLSPAAKAATFFPLTGTAKITP